MYTWIDLKKNNCRLKLISEGNILTKTFTIASQPNAIIVFTSRHVRSTIELRRGQCDQKKIAKCL